MIFFYIASGITAVLCMPIIVPMYCPVHFRFGIYMFHDIYFATFGPAELCYVFSKRPEGRPYAFGCRQFNTCFNFTVCPVLQTLGFHASRGIITTVIRFFASDDQEVTIIYFRIFRAGSIIFQFIVSPATSAGFKFPVSAVYGAAIKLIRPYKSPVLCFCDNNAE